MHPKLPDLAELQRRVGVQQPLTTDPRLEGQRKWYDELRQQFSEQLSQQELLQRWEADGEFRMLHRL